MSKCYTSHGRRYCRRTWKPAIFAVAAIIGLVLVGTVAARSLSEFPTPATFTIADDFWDVTDRLYGGWVSGYQDVVIPSTIVPSTFPTQIVGMSSTMLKIDPDRLTTTPVQFEYSYTPTQSNMDGALPTVVMGISGYSAADRDGNVLDQAAPDKQWNDESTGKTWYTYYFLLSAVIKTEVSYTTDYVYSRSGGEKLTPTETLPVDFALWVAVHVESKTTNSSFTSQSAGARIVAVKNFLIPKNVATTKTPIFTGDTPDDHWAVYNDQDIGTKLSVYKTQGSESDHDFIYEVSGTLDPGLIYARGGWQERRGVDTSVNVGIEYGLLIGVTVSNPLGATGETKAWWITVVDYIISQAQDPTGIGFWLLLAAALLIVVWLLRPKKKQQQAVNVYLGGEPQKQQEKKKK